jgi:hypothetical protein
MKLLSEVRTVERIMMSFSPPWKASTVDIWTFLLVELDEPDAKDSDILSACSLSILIPFNSTILSIYF